MITASNLLESVPETLPEEFSQKILTQSGVTIERIVSRGHHSPEGFWYDQTWDEWVLLTRGNAGLEIEGQPDMIELHAGDHLLIPAGTRHRVAWTDEKNDTIWLAVHIHSRKNL
jgi:cupin 2 domain-containing protein